jgi:MFS transporter, DHA2 family, multidrug resistance protein
LRQQQAPALAYFDVFLLLAVAILVPLIPVLLMKRSVAEKGTSVLNEVTE